jgi:hypothetical protein
MSNFQDNIREIGWNSFPKNAPIIFVLAASYSVSFCTTQAEETGEEDSSVGEFTARRRFLPPSSDPAILFSPEGTVPYPTITIYPGLGFTV